MSEPSRHGAALASIAVDRGIRRIDKLFDYLIPPALERTVTPGKRVSVPFGRGSRVITGTVIRVYNGDAADGIKPVLSVIDAEPVLSKEMLSVAAYLRESTYCTWFEAVRQLLPPGAGVSAVETYAVSGNTDDVEFAKLSADERAVLCAVRASAVPLREEQIEKRTKIPECRDVLKKLCERKLLISESTVKRNSAATTVKSVHLSGNAAPERLTEGRKKVIDFLKTAGSATVKEVCSAAGVTSSVVANMIKRGFLETETITEYRRPYVFGESSDETPLALTGEQQKAYDALAEDYRSPEFRTALLFGVTGSGKTSVYLKLLDLCVKDGKSAIVTVPEIALTPQTVKIFGARYGDKVAVFHSAMSAGQRFDEWRRVKEGKATIAVGTRSAVFAPLDNIGLIIIDEEQESSYKSEKSPRYRAAGVARLRAGYHGALLLLCSATPSIESYSRADAGEYRLVILARRYGNAKLPSVETVDMRKEQAKGNTSIFSSTLESEVGAALDAKKQAILLLNRRGHNTFISCPVCGYVATCEQCSISLTYHSSVDRCVCHYCGKSVPPVRVCPSCGNPHLRYSGLGTQKAEAQLRELFPGARVLRMDADSTATREAYEQKLSAFGAGKYDIMIGTQMVAKGLDFPNVTVVGVLNADLSLYSDDFRSFERTFSLLTQVVGRAGRGDNPGKAVIQTFDPENKIIRLAANQDYVSFFRDEILNRRLMVYPPYCNLTAVYTVAGTAEAALAAARFTANFTENRLKSGYSGLKMIALGPVPCSVAMVKGRYRYRMIFKTGDISQTRKLFAELKENFYAENKFRDTDLIIDANPDSIL